MAQFNFTDGALPSGATLRRAAGPWSRTKRVEYTDLDLTSGVLPVGVTVQRAVGPWSRRAQTGAVETGTAANVARFDYDPPIENRVLYSWAKSALFILSTTYTSSQPDAATTKYVQGAVPLNGYAFDYFDSGASGIGVATYSVDIRGEVGGEILWICVQKASSGTTYKRVVLTTAWQRFEVTSADTRYAGFGVRRLGDTGPDEASAAQTYYVRRRQLNRGTFALAYTETNGAAINVPAVCRGLMLEPSAVTSDGTRPTESFAADVLRGGATGSVDVTYSDGSTETRVGTIAAGLLTLPASATSRIVSRIRIAGLASGVMEFGIEADVPRFDYNPTTGALRGLLVEPTSTNLQIGSGVINAPNFRINGTRSVGGTGADGAASSRIKRGDTPATGQVFDQYPSDYGAGLNEPRSYSVYIKNIDAQTATLANASTSQEARVDFASGVVTSRFGGAGVYTAGPNGTSRLSVSHAKANRYGYWTTMLDAPISTARNSAEFSCAQVEARSTPTTYIPTTNAAATRPAETLTLDWTAQGVPDGLAGAVCTFANGSIQMIEQQITAGVSTVDPTVLSQYQIVSITILETPKSRTLALIDTGLRSATLIDTGSRSLTVIDAGSRSAEILT